MWTNRPGTQKRRPPLAAGLDDGTGELEHVDRLAVVDEVRLPGRRTARHQMLGGEDESVNQVVHVGVVELDVLAADQNLDVAGQHALEQLAEHRLIAAAPDAAGPDRAGQQSADIVLAQDELLGHHLGLGVEVVESRCVGQGFVTVGDALTAHHHAVGRGVDKPLDPGRLCGVHQVLGAADVDVETALAVLLGDRGSAHQVDDRRGVDDRVDPGDRRGDGVGVADVALEHFEALVLGQRRGRPVEGADADAALQQFGHQVGADEPGATGDQDAAEWGCQSRITHGGENN